MALSPRIMVKVWARCSSVFTKCVDLAGSVFSPDQLLLEGISNFIG